MQQESTSDIIKVFIVHLAAIGITMSGVEWFLKMVSLGLAIGYGVWKWRIDYLKNKHGKN